MTLAIRLLKSRHRKGLTQEQLGKQVGLCQQAIQRLESGKVKSSRAIVPLAEALEVCPYWLAAGPGDEPVVKPRKYDSEN